MDETESFDQEPPENSRDKSAPPLKPRRSFSKLRRELTDEELTSPAVQRLLLDEIERLERQASDLEIFRNRYYELAQRNAVLEQKAKRIGAADVVFGVCLCTGAAALGYAPVVWQVGASGYLCIAFGAILILGGTVAKLILR